MRKADGRRKSCLYAGRMECRARGFGYGASCEVITRPTRSCTSRQQRACLPDVHCAKTHRVLVVARFRHEALHDAVDDAICLGELLKPFAGQARVEDERRLVDDWPRGRRGRCLWLSAVHAWLGRRRRRRRRRREGSEMRCVRWSGTRDRDPGEAAVDEKAPPGEEEDKVKERVVGSRRVGRQRWRRSPPLGVVLRHWMAGYTRCVVENRPAVVSPLHQLVSHTTSLSALLAISPQSVAVVASTRPYICPCCSSSLSLVPGGRGHSSNNGYVPSPAQRTEHPALTPQTPPFYAVSTTGLRARSQRRLYRGHVLTPIHRPQ